jgi:ApaG protein
MADYDVKVAIEPEYLPEQSDEAASQYAFAYHVTIENNSAEPVQLISRYWVFTDGGNKRQEVRGAGVVGQQPVILPGESHSYTSGVVFETKVGTMEGSFQMVSESGKSFDALIYPVRLAAPGSVH